MAASGLTKKRISAKLKVTCFFKKAVSGLKNSAAKTQVSS